MKRVYVVQEHGDSHDVLWVLGFSPSRDDMRAMFVAVFDREPENVYSHDGWLWATRDAMQIKSRLVGDEPVLRANFSEALRGSGRRWAPISSGATGRRNGPTARSLPERSQTASAPPILPLHCDR